jgi:CBS domain-containing protein
MVEAIGAVMTPDPIVLSGSATTLGAARAMRDAHHDAVIVIEAHGLGIATAEDIALGAVAEGGDVEHVEIATICVHNLVALNPTQTVGEAIQLMRERAFRRLPVVHDGTPVGIVSLGALALERDLDGDLGNDSFFFEGPSGHFDFRAPSLIAFVQVAAKVSDETWLRHLREGNYSRWFREVLNDPVLAEEAAAFECRHDEPAAASRAGVRAAIKRLYATT